MIAFIFTDVQTVDGVVRENKQMISGSCDTVQFARYVIYHVKHTIHQTYKLKENLPCKLENNVHLNVDSECNTSIPTVE